MGQRFQIYIRTPKVFYQETNPNNQPALTLGYHHQWLYGATAVEMMDWALRVIDKNRADEYTPLKNPQESVEKFQFILSLLNGHKIERIHILNNAVKNPYGGTKYETFDNPDNGDNNDGFFVIDMEDVDNIAVCFGSLGHTEGKYSLSRGLYSPFDYLKSYYPQDGQKDYTEELLKMEPRGGSEMVEVMRRLCVVPMVTKERLRVIFPDWTV